MKRITPRNLEQWFSQPRMSTYAHHRDPEALYVWNTQLSKSFLEDIAHVEVLLRKSVDTSISPRYGDDWYDNSLIPFDRIALRSVEKAKRRARGNRPHAPLPGQVIAELSFDFWAYLFTETYSATIWPAVLGTLTGTRVPTDDGKRSRVRLPSLNEFKAEVDVVYRLRNRCAHHEPLVMRQRSDEDAYLDRCETAINNVARWFDPAASQWIRQHSRVPNLRLTRP